MASREDPQVGVLAEAVARDAQLVVDTDWWRLGFAADEAEISLVRVEIVVGRGGYIERAVLIEKSSFADMEDLTVKVMSLGEHSGERFQLLGSRTVHYLRPDTELVGRSSAAIGSVQVSWTVSNCCSFVA